MEQRYVHNFMYGDSGTNTVYFFVSPHGSDSNTG